MGGESWENLQAMDISLFEETVINLLEGKEVQLPRFNFITGKKSGMMNLSDSGKTSLF